VDGSAVDATPNCTDWSVNRTVPTTEYKAPVFGGGFEKSNCPNIFINNNTKIEVFENITVKLSPLYGSEYVLVNFGKREVYPLDHISLIITLRNYL
jgi:hypothetical protein